MTGPKLPRFWITKGGVFIRNTPVIGMNSVNFIDTRCLLSYDRIWNSTGQIILNPPLNDEISDFFSRGFNIFQISQNVRLGVLIFSMLWPFLDHFALKNSLKKAQNFSRASRANFFSGVLIFSKIQDFFRGGVLSTGGVLILSPRYWGDSRFLYYEYFHKKIQIFSVWKSEKVLSTSNTFEI